MNLEVHISALVIDLANSGIPKVRVLVGHLRSLLVQVNRGPRRAECGDELSVPPAPSHPASCSLLEPTASLPAASL